MRLSLNRFSFLFFLFGSLFIGLLPRCGTKVFLHFPAVDRFRGEAVGQLFYCYLIVYENLLRQNYFQILDLLSGHTSHKGVIRHVFRHHRTGGDNGIPTYRHTRTNGGAMQIQAFSLMVTFPK